ncbi:MAG: hypothetical protein IPK83_08940 [Planctomycetes bacterium]|nr:hypothetical protein [Planctomycetota bacterium]
MLKQVCEAQFSRDVGCRKPWNPRDNSKSALADQDLEFDGVVSADGFNIGNDGHHAAKVRYLDLVGHVRRDGRFDTHPRFAIKTPFGSDF